MPSIRNLRVQLARKNSKKLVKIRTEKEKINDKHST